jgi:hypothetical protein
VSATEQDQLELENELEIDLTQPDSTPVVTAAPQPTAATSGSSLGDLDDLFSDLPSEGDISMADLSSLLEAEDEPPVRPVSSGRVKGATTKANKAPRAAGDSSGQVSRAKVADSADVEEFHKNEFPQMNTRDAAVALARRYGLATNVVTSTLNAWGRKILYQQVRSYLLNSGLHRKQDGTEGTNNAKSSSSSSGPAIERQTIKVKQQPITKESIARQIELLTQQLAMLSDDNEKVDKSDKSDESEEL